MRGFVLGRSRYPPKRSGVAEGDVNQGCGTHENETSSAGLRPEDIYVYVEHIPCGRRPNREAGTSGVSQGRANRPFLVDEHGCPKQSRTLEGKPAQSKPQYTNIQREAKPVGKSGNGIARSMV